MTADPALLRRAAGIIREGGLSKGRYCSEGSHCTIGALGAAADVLVYGVPMLPTIRDEVSIVAEVVGLPPSSPGGDLVPGESHIYAWNDHPATTAADVIAVFETAAEKLEADR